MGVGREVASDALLFALSRLSRGGSLRFSIMIDNSTGMKMEQLSPLRRFESFASLEAVFRGVRTRLSCGH